MRPTPWTFYFGNCYDMSGGDQDGHGDDGDPEDQYEDDENHEGRGEDGDCAPRRVTPFSGDRLFGTSGMRGIQAARTESGNGDEDEEPDGGIHGDPCWGGRSLSGYRIFGAPGGENSDGDEDGDGSTNYVPRGDGDKDGYTNCDEHEDGAYHEGTNCDGDGDGLGYAVEMRRVRGYRRTRRGLCAQAAELRRLRQRRCAAL